MENSKSFLFKFLAMLSLLVTTPVQSQISLVTDKTFNFNNRNEIANNICSNSAGGFIISGNTWVINCDNQGDSLWSKDFSGINSENICNILNLNNDSLLIVGSKKGNGWVSIIDNNGNTILSKLFDLGYSEKIRSIVKLSTGGFMAVGTSGSKILVLRFNNILDTIWTKTYGPSNCNATGIISIDEQNFIITAYKDIQAGYCGNKWLLKINLNGDTLWTRTFSQSFIEVSKFTATLLNNGFIALVGDSCYINQDKNNIWYGIINQSGDIIKNIMLPTCGGWDALKAVSPLKDGGFLAVGVTECGTLAEDNAIALLFDSNGDTLCSYIFGSTGIDEINDICIVNDSIYAFSGSKNNDFWIGFLEYHSSSISINNSHFNRNSSPLHKMNNSVYTLNGKLLNPKHARSIGLVVKKGTKSLFNFKK